MRCNAVALVEVLVVGFAWASCVTKGSPAPAPSPATRPTGASSSKVGGGESSLSITARKDGCAMVLVPAGSFVRGDEGGLEGEEPQRSIHIDVFHIDKHEVTVAQYRKCVQAGSCTAPDKDSLTAFRCNWILAGRDDHPLNCADWNQARSYCSWAGKRLPTEAEWEKAARGTDGRKYPWGSEKPSCRQAVMDDGGFGCGKGGTWPVGRKSPDGDSPYGAQDMAGNVWEWVSDWYEKDYYTSSPAKNPAGPTSGESRVVRGGSWSNPAYHFRAAYRHSWPPEYRGGDLGFRCAR